MRTAPLLVMSCVIVMCLGCEYGIRSGRGLRLPEGDIERGTVAFRELGCPKCHDVAGGPPAPDGERAAMIVELGGKVTRVETYGELVTSIINPSHKIGRRYPKDQVTKGGVSIMEAENFNDRMTVAQLIDLVTFLQSKYEIRREPEFMP